MSKSSKCKIQIGYALISEEHSPEQLINNAQQAEKAGFKFALVSDHFHPWIDNQGQSPFVWSILGALSQATKSIQIGTGVTCPTMRYHPAIVAQAAATVATMMPNRFFLGLGTGENLNEHITGMRWPDYDMRASMLEEAVKIIRTLWKGKVTTYYGRFYIIDNARIYTLPEKTPQILIAASGKNSARLAGQIGDGLITTSEDPDIIKEFKAANKNKDSQCYGYLSVCYADDEEKARKLAVEQWPNAGLPGELGQELKTSKHFEQAAHLVNEETIAKQVICGSDIELHIKQIQKSIERGINRIYIHQIGPEQEKLLKVYEAEVLPFFQSKNSKKPNKK
jgi:coenzyme F420-dependent glucose-6-phosphate dehydrogenase